MDYILNIIPDILFVLVLTGLAAMPFIIMAWKSEVEACRYKMFAVRDRLVLLVAQDKLNEESVLFRYYYKRSNDILRLTETLNLEGLYQILISTKLSEDRIHKHEKRMQEVNVILDGADPEVKEVIRLYYAAIIELMMVNSNLFSFVYVVSNHRFKESVRQKMLSWAEKNDPKTASVFHDVECEKHQLGLA